MSFAASPGGLCQLLSRPFTCSPTHTEVNNGHQNSEHDSVAKASSCVQFGLGLEQARPPARTYQALGEGVDVAEGLEAGEVRPDPGDGDADWESGTAEQELVSSLTAAPGLPGRGTRWEKEEAYRWSRRPARGRTP